MRKRSWLWFGELRRGKARARGLLLARLAVCLRLEQGGDENGSQIEEL